LQLLVADHAAAIGDRRLEHLGEHLVGHLAAQRFEDRQFFRAGQLGGGQWTVGEKLCWRMYMVRIICRLAHSKSHSIARAWRTRRSWNIGFAG
jgi:hypothetical protein